MNLKQPVQLCLPLLSLEISFKFISLQYLTWNHLPFHLTNYTLANWYNRPIINYLLLFLNNILGAVWKKMN